MVSRIGQFPRIPPRVRTDGELMAAEPELLRGHNGTIAQCRARNRVQQGLRVCSMCVPHAIHFARDINMQNVAEIFRAIAPGRSV
jgi:hypothetical protein